MPIISWQTCESNGTTGGGLSWKQLHDSSMEADSMETQVQKFTQVGCGNMRNYSVFEKCHEKSVCKNNLTI